MPTRSIVAVALLTLALLLVPIPAQATSYGAHGSKVAFGDADYAVTYSTLAALTGAVVCRISAGAVGVLDDYYYLHPAADCTGNVLQGDIRLVTTNGGSAGTVVASGNADLGTTFTLIVGTTFLAGVGYMEADGLTGFTPGDFVYYSADATVDVTNGDIRLSGNTNSPSTGTVTNTAGTVVGASTSADVTEATDGDGLFPESATLVGQGLSAIRYFDSNNDAAYTSQSDGVYLTPAGPADHPSLNDLHLTSLNSQTFGAYVTKSTTDYKAYRMTVLTAANAKLVTTDDTQPATAPQLFIHFVGVPDVTAIQHEDLVIKYTGGSIAGRVTSVAEGQGVAIDTSAGAAPNFIAQVFFVDTDGSTRYSPQTDPVYLHRSTTLGGTTNTLVVTAGDLRLTSVTVGASTYSAGSLVAVGDADIAAFASSTANGGAGGTWQLALHNVDRASAVPLTSLTNAKVTGTNFAGTDGAYISTNSVVTAGDLRIVAGGLSAIACPGDANCGVALTADTNVRTTGTDGTLTVGTAGECAYYSKDAYVNAGDRRFTTCLAVGAGVVAASDIDVFQRGGNTAVMSSGDELYLQWCETGCPVNAQMRPGDLIMASGSITRVTGATAGHVPTLTAATPAANTCPFPSVKRIDVAANGIPTDDAFYLSFSAAAATATAIRAGDFRLTPYTSTAAGTQVTSSSTAETTSAVTCSATAPASLIKYLDIDGVTGYTASDGVYVDTVADLGGTTGLNQGDIRLTPVTVTGTTYTAGTIAILGDKDLPGMSYAGTQPTWTLYSFDEDRDGTVSTGDTVYANPGAASTSLNPGLLAVRIGGSGGSSSSTGGSSSGGGGTTVVTTPSNSVSNSVSSSVSTSDSTSESETGSSSETPASISAANLAIKASLDVKREDGKNILTWDAQAGVDGYQVFSSNSPFVLLATLSGQGTHTYTDPAGETGTNYLVTAYLAGEELTAADVNGGHVPGYTGTPKGEDVGGGGGKGFIPGFEVVGLITALAAAVLVTRRKLD